MALNDRSKIVEKNIEEEMKTSYIDYSMSVIVSRALPDVRDGLKPSQRRILVAMNDLNLAPGRPYRKCAKIAGDTSGNYHPHGEQVVYPTLVRLAQEWVMRYPLVDGQGNFGSIDGDAPAAMRYTEARLTPLAVEMLADLEKNTVDFRPNYDETREEPSVLPGVLPNLLVNGCSGIAVGMATEVPPHNLTEVCEAIIQVIERPEITAEELLKIVTGPDFPTGGIIYGGQGIRDCYLTGRGLIRMRAQVQVEEGRAGRLSLVATQIPFQVNKAMLLERIADMVREGRLTGISDLRDESDRDGMRIVIELKKDANPKVVLNQLFVHTPLQSTFGAIMLGLVNNRPQVLTLRALLDQYVMHRQVVVRRRTEFDLAEAERRAHILEGLKIALDHLDAVIALIRAAKDVDTARTGLMAQFKLSEIQANAILEMRLQRLTGLERAKIEQEYRSHSADRTAAFHPGEREEDAGDHPGRGAPAEGQVRRRAPHRDRRRRGRDRLRGHHRAEGHGDHDLARRLHQAPGGHRLPLAAPRRQGRDRRPHQGRGLHRAPVRGQHARPPADPDRQGALLLAQGARGRTGRAHGARPAAGQSPRGPVA
jgi:DNA gyrase subunit A